MNQPTGFCCVQKRTIWQRLGFGTCQAPRPDEEEDAPGWAPSWFIVETRADLDWKDRLRVLVTGRLMIQSAIKTDVTISRSRATTAISILPPGGCVGMNRNTIEIGQNLPLTASSPLSAAVPEAPGATGADVSSPDPDAHPGSTAPADGSNPPPAAFSGTGYARSQERTDLNILADIRFERRRRIEDGYTAEHDDAHATGALAIGAAAFALYAAAGQAEKLTDVMALSRRAEDMWPWSLSAAEFKPGSARCCLIKAAAMIVAEIARLDRPNRHLPGPTPGQMGGGQSAERAPGGLPTPQPPEKIDWLGFFGRSEFPHL
jgi:hypothetical protein